jgi:hypothetical protein
MQAQLIIFFDVPPPEAYLKWKTNSNKRPKNATIEVTYTGFTPEAEAAFQTAVDIWESLISSPVTIRIQAQWTPLSSGVLGSAGTHSNYSQLFRVHKN